MKIVIKDETIGGETKNSFTIETASETATVQELIKLRVCLLYTSPSPRDATLSRMPSSA